MFTLSIRVAVAGPKPVPSRTVMKTKFKPHTVSATGEPVAPAAPSIKKPRYAIDENSFVLYNPGELNTETLVPHCLFNVS